MIKPGLQLNQLFADPLLAQSLKGQNALLGQLEGQGIAKGGDMFGSLLGGLLMGRKNTLLTSAPTQNNAPNEQDILKGLPDDLLALMRANDAANTSDNMPDGILNALSSATQVEPDGDSLFAVIDDPELAAALAGLASQIGTAENNSLASTEKTTLSTQDFAATFGQALSKMKAYAKAMKEDGTITLADLDGDSFQYFKKLAFADIAPYLTQPRTVVVEGKSVMKIAQGPAFLNEDAGDITEIALLSGMGAEANLKKAELSLDLDLNLQQATQALKANEASGTIAPQPLNIGVLPSMRAQAQGNSKGDTFIEPELALNADNQTKTSLRFEQSAEQVLKQNQNILPNAPTPQVQTTATSASNLSEPNILFETEGQNIFSNLPLNFVDTNNKPVADSLSINNALSQLLSGKVAGQAHPATHLVSLSISRHINPTTPGTERQFTIHMQPETLGHVRVTLQFGDNKSVKVNLVAERPETLALLQKDIGLLERNFADEGLDASNADSFTFDLAGGDSFADSMHEGTHEQNAKSKDFSDDDAFGTVHANVNTTMPIFVDPETGLTHVNIVI